MAAALTFTAAALPAAQTGRGGLVTNGNSNGNNSGAWTYAGGTPGAGDTIANAELLKGLSTTSRIYDFLSASYATQLELDQTMAALGVVLECNGGSALRLITAAPGVPTATVTTAAATGSVRISLGASQSS